MKMTFDYRAEHVAVPRRVLRGLVCGLPDGVWWQAKGEAVWPRLYYSGEWVAPFQLTERLGNLKAGYGCGE